MLKKEIDYKDKSVNVYQANLKHTLVHRLKKIASSVVISSLLLAPAYAEENKPNIIFGQN